MRLSSLGLRVEGLRLVQGLGHRVWDLGLGF